MESWVGEFDQWTPCSGGMIAWLEGFVAGSTMIRQNFNFGSNALSEDPAQWNEQEFMDALFSRAYPFVRGYPQIYCSVSNEWLRLFKTYPESIYFYGVTSDNAGSSPCEEKVSLRWMEAWMALDMALDRNDTTQNALVPSVSIFHIVLPVQSIR